MVGALPRQAEDRDVHAAREDPGRDRLARAAARDRRDLERPRPRRGRADDAAERPAPLPRSGRAPGRLRPARTPRASPRPARAATRCATSPAARSPASPHDELFDPTPVLEEAAALFYGNPDYSDLPRKHKIAITACADSCAAPEINCVGLVGALRDGEEGFGVLVGGGLSSVPRIARELGIWVPKDDAVTVLAAILDVWREDLRYRVSRVKARLKFMVDDLGPEGVRERVERGSAARFDDFQLPPAPPPGNHLGVHEQRRRPLLRRRARAPRAGHRRPDDRARRARRVGSEVRITRQQNLVAHERRRRARASSGARRDRAAARRRPLRGDAIACTGEPHCNFSVTETKTRMDGLVGCSRTGSATTIDGLRLHLDGCPHACAQHWVGDLGFQGTTVRDAEGRRRQAYDVYLRGSLDRPAAIARPVFRRVPTEELDDGSCGTRRRLGRRSASDGRDVPLVLRPHNRRRACSPVSSARRREEAAHDRSICSMTSRPASWPSSSKARSPRSCSSGRSSASRRASRSRPRSRPTAPCCCTWRTSSIRRSACSASTPAGCRRRRSS